MNWPAACVVWSAIRMKYWVWNASVEVSFPAPSASTMALSAAARRSTSCTLPAKPNKLPLKVSHLPASRPIKADSVRAAAPTCSALNTLDCMYNWSIKPETLAELMSVGLTPIKRNSALTKPSRIVPLYQGCLSIIWRSSGLDCTSDTNSFKSSDAYSSLNRFIERILLKMAVSSRLAAICAGAKSASGNTIADMVAA